jgi:hypothetical protein
VAGQTTVDIQLEDQAHGHHDDAGCGEQSYEVRDFIAVSQTLDKLPDAPFGARPVNRNWKTRHIS